VFKFSKQLATALVMVIAAFSNADVIDGENLVDPTRPFFTNINSESDSDSILEMVRTVVPSSYELTFIRAGSSAPMAVINDQQVTIGDMIGGAVVMTIDRSSVTLLINDEEKQINLYGTNIKAPVAGQ